MNSTFANHEKHRQMQGETLGRLEMHADDAATRGISDGMTVTIRNERGALTLTALISARVRPGVVTAGMGWNKRLQDELPGAAPAGGVNLLTSQRLTDLGGGPTFYSTLVFVELAAEITGGS